VIETATSCPYELAGNGVSLGCQSGRLALQNVSFASSLPNEKTKIKRNSARSETERIWSRHALVTTRTLLYKVHFWAVSSTPKRSQLLAYTQRAQHSRSSGLSRNVEMTVNLVGKAVALKVQSALYVTRQAAVPRTETIDTVRSPHAKLSPGAVNNLCCAFQHHITDNTASSALKHSLYHRACRK